ncbi:MAG: pilus assembly protein PilX [Burkholderiaceae bacterium]|nr:MAG: pilus assembly protein PilX [Burkholderiaceae bacterium]
MTRLPAPKNTQLGATLLFALLTLVALMLSTLALVRSTDIASILMGNLGFKQDATASSEQATRQAIDWLTGELAALNADKPDNGYYASTKEDGVAPLDTTGTQLANTAVRQLIDWDDDDCEYAASGSFQACDLKPVNISSPINKNSASYIIFRMCDKSGDPSTDSTINCLRPMSSVTSDSPIKGELNYSEAMRFGSSAGTYYRIIVRVQGARNTVSFTETIVHF